MREEIKKQIEEMKGIVLDLHRSAGNLDEQIRLLENELDDPGCNGVYVNMYVQHLCRHRNDFKLDRKYNDFDEKEDKIWQQLINAVRGDRAQ